MKRKVLAAVLAAGASSRFGSAKQLAVVDGKALIEHVQIVLLESTADEVIVVLGCNHTEIEKHILPEFTAINNDNWEEGIGSSVRLAVQSAFSADATHLLLLVCDQPYVSTCLIDRILSTSKFEESKIIACRYGDTFGVPALFPREYFASLNELKGDKGAKSVIKASQRVEFVEFPEGLIDIDFQADLKASSP